MQFKIQVLLVLLLSNFGLYAEELRIFSLMQFENSINKPFFFVSISDVYTQNEDNDSIAMPDTEGLDKENAGSIYLESNYRKRILSRSNIKETDKIYIYEYYTNKTHTLSVKSLALVALLNGYTSTAECPCPKHYYMIGFKLDHKFSTSFYKHYYTSFVSIGKENPFIQGKLKPVTWKNVEANLFPDSYSRTMADSIIRESGIKGILKTGEVYLFETDGLKYFIRDIYYRYNYYTNEIIGARQLLVIQKNTGEAICEKYFGIGEGTSLKELGFADTESYIDYQWTGKLFKNKPAVIFGFQNISFGCPGITFIEPSAKEIFINCDNRH